MLKPLRCLFLAVLFWSAVSLARADLVTENLNTSLDSGSLSGTMFPVTFSYDSNEVNPVGESFVPLESFGFVLLGVPQPFFWMRNKPKVLPPQGHTLRYLLES
jgi:hypothetical protein